MKVAALVLGLLGSLAILFLGAVWIMDYKKSRDAMSSLQQMAGGFGVHEAISRSVREMESDLTAAYVMIALGIVSLFASFLVLRFSRLSGVLMLIAVVIPALIAPKTLAFSFLLTIAGILALFSKGD